MKYGCSQESLCLYQTRQVAGRMEQAKSFQFKVVEKLTFCSFHIFALIMEVP